jgi:putative ABC transport system permease protein
MWSNYLTVGVRALTKNRIHAFINIFGLAIGLAAFLLILLYARYESSYDAWLPEADRLYQLQTINTDAESGTVERMQMSPMAATRAFARDFPEVELAAYVTNSQPVILQRGEPVQRTITLADPDFFRIYDIPFLHGSGTATLAQPGTIAISARTAQAMFGTTSAIGRVVTVLGEGNRTAYRVSGVFADLPDNSHQAFGMMRRLMPADLAERQETHWGWLGGYTYFKLRPGSDVDSINARLNAWAARVAPTEQVGSQTVSQVAENRFRLVPLPEVHLSGAGSGPAGRGNDRGTIVTFVAVGALILAMAVINFVNLATARASTRAREVSLRKLAGASRRQLVTQFLAESILIVAVAMLLGLAIAELSMPWLRDFTGLDLDFTYLGRDGVLPQLAALTLLVGLAGGLYPAVYLTRFKPAEILRANRSAAEPSGSGRLRGILVVGQFAISIGLIVCTAVIYAQTVYARSVDPGFKREGLLQIEGIERAQVLSRIEALRDEIGRIPGVEGSALTQIGVETSSRVSNSVTLPGRSRPLDLGTYNVDFGFIETMGIELLAGRTLSQANALDDATLPAERDDAAEQALVARGINVVVNRSATRRLGFGTPAEAIGQQIGIGFVDPSNGVVPARIVGVVADTRFRSIREPVEDIVYFRNANRLGYLLVRFAGGDHRALADRVEAAWRRVIPDVPFAADLADDRIVDLYRSERARAGLFGGAALLAVMIACLGLFGLAAFTAERRTKEIGIRKVFGATVRDIVKLLAWQFSKPVVLANLLAWPVAWWVMREWLNQFDARIALTPGPFLLAGLLALAIALATISGHAIRVARTNPIHALRYE